MNPQRALIAGGRVRGCTQHQSLAVNATTRRPWSRQHDSRALRSSAQILFGGRWGPTVSGWLLAALAALAVGSLTPTCSFTEPAGYFLHMKRKTPPQ